MTATRESTVPNSNRNSGRLPVSGTGPSRDTPAVAGFRDVFELMAPYKWVLILAFTLGLAGTTAAAAQPLLVSGMVDGFAGGLPAASIAVLVVLLVASAACTGLQQLILERSGERFAFDSRRKLIGHVFRLPIPVLDRHDRADIVSRITTDVAQMRSILSAGLVELATSVVAVTISVVMMAVIDGVLLLLAAVVIAVLLSAIVLIGRRTRPVGLRLQTAVGDLAGAVSRVLGSIRTVRATLSTEREADGAIVHAAAALSAGLAAARLRAMIQTFAGVTVQLLLISIVAVGALRVASGALSVGGLSAFIMYLLLMVAPIATFASMTALLGEAFGALSRVKQLHGLELERDVEDDSCARSEPVRDSETPLFDFADVSFGYPSRRDESEGAETLVLRNLNLRIEPNRTTAIVGSSGAGKSTVFALLERFYEPSLGTLTFNGRDVRALSRAELRRQVAYVEQDAPMLSGTMRENLLLGHHSATDEQCIEALEAVNLATSPGSGASLLDSQVGEFGSMLSGGERQRLAIARALIRGASVLLLDEVTSNLDSKNERIIQDLLRTRANGMTIVVIAHRLSTVVAADTIVVLDKGTSVAEGNHNELLSRSPLYREFAENQLVG